MLPSPPTSSNHLPCRASVSPACKAAALPAPLAPCCSDVSAQRPGGGGQTKQIYKYCIFSPRRPSFPRRSPGLTLSPRVHLNSKKGGRGFLPREPGQPGRALIREEVLPGREILSLYCSMRPAKPLCRQGKLRHAKGGQRGEGEHVFCRESLFLPSQEECQARGTAGSDLPNAAHALPLTSPASPRGYSCCGRENPLRGLHRSSYLV